MDERQKSISMGQAINIASELVLKNEFMVSRTKELTSQELSARLMASVPHIYSIITSMQESIERVTGAMQPKAEPEKQVEAEEEFD